MSSSQDLRKRIKSVTNTQQITRAMKMVASARLRRAQAKAQGTEPYTQKLHQILVNVASSVAPGDITDASLLEVRPVKKTLYLILGNDKGLAGAYTGNLLKYFQGLVDRADGQYEVITVGRKIRDHLKVHQYPLAQSYVDFSDHPLYAHAQDIIKEATRRFTDKEVDRVVLIYTHFVNSLTQTVQSTQLLPVETPKAEGKSQGSYLFAPEAGEIMSKLLPMYLETTVYGGLLQAAASELGARMTAMTSATDNAGELISQLNLEYNKLRQASITNEISEIVGGANALQ